VVVFFFFFPLSKFVPLLPPSLDRLILTPLFFSCLFFLPLINVLFQGRAARPPAVLDFLLEPTTRRKHLHDPICTARQLVKSYERLMLIFSFMFLPVAIVKAMRHSFWLLCSLLSASSFDLLHPIKPPPLSFSCAVMERRPVCLPPHRLFPELCALFAQTLHLGDTLIFPPPVMPQSPLLVLFRLFC